MDSFTKELFDVIFQEAHVIDFDFSKWDKEVSLVVIGGLVGANFDDQGPIHRVAFYGVKEMRWESTHLGVKLESDDQHCQWVIMDFDVKETEGFLSVFLNSVAPPCPKLTIVCCNVEIREISASTIDRVNPSWNQPYSSLARPGLEDLSRQFSRYSE